MDAVYEIIITVAMMLFWAIELFYGLLARDAVIAGLSFLLLFLWLDELFPIKKDLEIGFNRKIFITVIVVLSQQTLRFFL